MGIFEKLQDFASKAFGHDITSNRVPGINQTTANITKPGIRVDDGEPFNIRDFQVPYEDDDDIEDNQTNIQNVVAQLIDSIKDQQADSTALDEYDGDNPYVATFEVPVNKSHGNLLVEIIQDSAGETINFFQEVNATDTESNATPLNNIAQKINATTQELLKKEAAGKPNGGFSSIHIVSILIVMILVGLMVGGIVWKKKRNGNAIHRNSGDYNVSQFGKNLNNAEHHQNQKNILP
ncbi:uncharacterized protein LOC132701028 [Cylas formicarius]|uniref:uncharacterized protein LOC132701028 n=1 Tax=Cylas formicarius TaxID=197179 RepID=UPI0029587E23|nr:uncharacterized protein LOC132701028 [Cylas formicarius]